MADPRDIDITTAICDVLTIFGTLTPTEAEVSEFLAPLYSSDYPLWVNDLTPKMHTPYVEQWVND